MHFTSSLRPRGINSSGPQEHRTSDESQPTQLLYHPLDQRRVALQQPCLKGACIPEVRAPRYYPCSPAIDISITQLLAMAPITGAGWSTAQVPQRQVLHFEQDVLLKPTSRRVWGRQLSLSPQKLQLECSLQATHLLQLPKSKCRNQKVRRPFHWGASNSSAAFPNNFLFLIKLAISHPSWMRFLYQMSPDWQKFIFH